MFLTNTAQVSFDNLDFAFNVPGDVVATQIYQVSREIMSAEAVTPGDFAKLGGLMAPQITKYPDGWDNMPELTKNRLLFEIAKFFINESLTIPEIKKK